MFYLFCVMLHHLWIIGTSNAAETGGTVLLSRHFSQPDSTEESRDAELRALAEPVVKLVDVMASTPLYASTMAMAARANKIE